MSVAITPASLATVRSVIARTMLGEDAAVPDRIGEITLRPHQRAAVARLNTLITANGGALLAEPVGLGKTYAALAVAAHSGLPIVIALPAGLRDMWRDAVDRCGVSATIVTHEALSRGVTLPAQTTFVIVDEAHRLRSPSTRRYAAVADLCRRARVLLVTATPVQNQRRDLAAQLALYLGRRAWLMSDAELTEHVVRGASSDMRGVPRLDGPHRVMLSTPDDCLDELLALPPPVPAKDETIIVALLTYGLVHQWTSSRAALVAALERRRVRGLALLSALDAGRQPTRAELSAWTHAGDAMQLAFPELVTAGATDANTDDALLASTLDLHVAAIEAMLRRLRSSADPDTERAEVLRRIRAAHPGERIIAFCHYAETVNTLRSRLARDAGVAALTANGARISSGRVPRDVVLAQFTPSSGAEVGPASRIDLLITTDLLSEGLNLQRASVVVHLDLPWNPARLEQRVGRARRLGSNHAAVTVYVVAPPVAADRLLRVEDRLREKLSVAQRTVGIAGRILPSPIGVAAPTSESSLAEQTGVAHTILRGWFDSPCVAARTVSSGPIVAAVSAEASGFVGVIRDGSGAHLVAELGAGMTIASEPVARALAAAGAQEAPVAPAAAWSALRQIQQWLAARHGALTIDLQTAAAARLRRAALVHVARALARAPRHQRALLAPLADTARSVATAPLAEGAERILEMLVRAELPDEAWLRSIAAFGELNARPIEHSERREAQVIAMILFTVCS